MANICQETRGSVCFQNTETKGKADCKWWLPSSLPTLRTTGHLKETYRRYEGHSPAITVSHPPISVIFDKKKIKLFQKVSILFHCSKHRQPFWELLTQSLACVFMFMVKGEEEPGTAAQNPNFASMLWGKACRTPYNVSHQSRLPPREDKSKSPLKEPFGFRGSGFLWLRSAGAEVDPFPASLSSVPTLCHPQPPQTIRHCQLRSWTCLHVGSVRKLCGQEAHAICLVYTSLLPRNQPDLEVNKAQRMDKGGIPVDTGSRSLPAQRVPLG